MGESTGELVPPASPGVLFQLIRSGRARTRAELAAHTGLARSTISQRVDLLLSRGLIYEAGEGPSTGGRPPLVLAFKRDDGVVLAADLGATHARLAVMDLGGGLLAEAASDIDIADGPDAVIAWVEKQFGALLKKVKRSPRHVRGVGVGLPGPVEFATGRPVNPPIMPGWDGVSVPDRVAAHFGVPVLVDNDVNIMALGEYHARWRETVDDLLFVKVGTGIGCGVVVGGAIHRGAQGAAGDIGHIPIPGHDDARCRCGNLGCVEAVAGGGAIADGLRALGHDATSTRDVVRLVRGGEPDAVRLVREGGRLLGEVLASAVNLLNPAVIVLGGEVANAHEQLLAGVREVVYRRSLPLATRHLRIVRSDTGDEAGVLGAAALVLDHLFSVRAIDQAVGA